MYLKSERELKKAKSIRNLLERKLFVIGIITSELRKSGITPVMVGGSAVEFYTSGAYESLDIDLVTKKRALIEKLLKDLGFENKDRHWFFPDLEIYIEIVGWNLSGSREKLTKVIVDKYEVFLIGIEDMVIDRLCACKFWQSLLDCEQAKVLLDIHKDEMDYVYLKKKARRDGVIEELAGILEAAGD